MNEKDTNKDAQEVLLHLYRQMSPATKTKRILEAYQAGRMLAMAGLRLRYPDANGKKIWYLWAKQHLGERLFNEVYGASPNE